MPVEPEGRALSGRQHDPVCVLLAGGRGSRLHELTDSICKPAVRFGPENRIVDFTLDNIRRSGLSQIIVASQYCAGPLEEYLDRAWRPVFGAGLRLRRAASKTRPMREYVGTADAVWKNSVEIDALAPREVVVLSADQVYAMDYRPMIEAHRASGAAVTIAADVVPATEARAFSCIEAKASGHVSRLVEKPRHPPRMQGRVDHSMISMGIYILNWAWLRAALAADAANPTSAHDFGHDILPKAVAEGQAQVHTVRGVANRPFFWRDVGTLDAFRATWLRFVDEEPPSDLPALGRIPLPFGLRGSSGGDARGQISADRVVPLSGARLQGAKGVLRGSILMPGARLSEGSLLHNAIVAPGTLVPPGLSVGEDPDEDARWFRVTPGGTTLITSEMLARRDLHGPRPLFISNHPFHLRSH